ncbi:predicted protein [Naegleria gruberi]|uniref:Predicted protein n=1 Tax=Naegleria gruberi TaxID=5762 RepID=D2V8Q1_NAEGR|nr:uncharacterized protein NAEGRDRAFT_65237 [Naegleria gruberi]EFC46840.1 predicted protein [Naegleria gruberi]|eukprot:XP_002679584.1 predicted protein [Naegleria gruberi strain NEG-M]
MVNQTSSSSSDKISDVPSPSSGGVKKIRKARVQAQRKTAEQNLQKEETGGEYNIWYHKYIGQQHQKKEIEPAESRCNIKTDAGWTVGCTLKDSVFCLFFAHGRCAEGAECKYLHRIPTTSDASRIPITKDCFGRPKHATDRDDMSGVGSFNRDCRTLYVSGFKYVSGVDYEEVLLRHFKEWGEVEYIRAFPEKCYAFVKYKNRLCAEFAKEAMLGQSLDNDDIIHIRWSADDPNPLATKRHEQEMKNKIKESLEEKKISTTSLPFHYPEGYTPENPIIPEHLQMNSKLQQVSAGAATNIKGTKSVEQQYYQHYLPQQADEKKSEQTYRDNLRKQGALANDDRKKVDYFNYIKGSNEKTNIHQQVSASLSSKVAASYPNTDSQLSQLSKEQQEQYQKFYQQFAQQLGQKK